MSGPDPELVAQCRQIMAHHAKSFDRAARFLPGRLRDPVAVLYAFCRTVDDTADTATDASDAQRELEAMRAELDGARPPRPVIAALRSLTAEPLMLAAADALVRGVMSDVGVVALADEAALVRYAYAVAGSVGVLMCGVLGVQDPVALPFAIDLGIAMQLTNIARDVREDALLGRVYLPGAALARRGVASADVVRGTAPRGAVAAVVLEVLALADRYYASADLGMRYLPDAARPAILVASRLYQAIGTRIRGWGGDALRGRAIVPRSDKAWHIGRGLARAWTTSSDPVVHTRELHAPLVGCPGANA